MLKLRAAESSDLAAVAAIHVACWRTAYRGIISDPIIDAVTVEARLASWPRWSREPGASLRVAERADAVVGFCRLCPAREIDRPPHGFAEITHLYVSPGAAGSGVGHALFSEALELAQSSAYRGLLLWVLERNERARRFYAAHGLHFDGARHTEPEWLGDGVYEVRYRVVFQETSE